MTLTLNAITLGVPQVDAARHFYRTTFAASTSDHGIRDVDLHSTGRLAFRQIDALASDLGTNPAASGFRGYALCSIVRQPAEVRALLDAATANGAEVVKVPKKQLFGEYAASFQAPDGAVWKLAASSKKDSAPTPDRPQPVETAIYLGVARPSVSKEFYETLGMSTEHDYGDKFVDFTISTGTCRLGLLPLKGLARDVGVDEAGEGFTAVALTHTADSPEEVDMLLSGAAAAGARVTAATTTDHDGYAGYFTDPDGTNWCITTRT